MATVTGSVVVDGQTFSASTTVTVTSQTPPTSTMLIGCSASNNDHGGTEDWDGWRVYAEGEMLERANRTGALRPLFLAYSKTGSPFGSTSQTAAQIEAAAYADALADFTSFYYTSSARTTRSSRWGIKLYRSNGNEMHDKGLLALPHTAANIDKFVAGQKGLYRAAHETFANGDRMFPDAYAGVNPTTEAERSGWVGDWLNTSKAGPWCDFSMWSIYPGGRDETVDDPTYNWPSESASQAGTAPHGYMIRCHIRTAAAGVPIIGIGEFGIGDNPADNRTRPFWIVYYLHVFLKLAAAYNLTPAFACWWDNELAGGPQNILTDEPAATNPHSVTALQNHLTYNKYRGGAHPASWPATPPSSWKQTGTFPTT